MHLQRDDIQGNILEGYRYRYASHVFLRFHEEGGQRFLRDVLGDVASAVSSPVQEGRRSVVNVALSHAGLRALMPGDVRLDAFPDAFREGMEDRHTLLRDAPATWNPEWRGRRVHAWLAVHGVDRGAVDDCVRTLRQRLGPAGEVVKVCDGNTIGDEGSEAQFEHFGFRDGLSNPSVVGTRGATRPGGGKPLPDGKWAPVAPGEFVLGYPDETGETPGELPPQLGRNGTFAVFRVLSQDVFGFRRYLQDVAEATGRSADEIAASIVGRRRDGTPLIRAPSDNANDFRYADDRYGSGCPLGSHVRRANLRDSTDFPDLVARHRIIRRGMPYGQPLPEHATERDEGERGLLFVCMNASIERQFEFIQTRWLNEGSSVHQGMDGDPLVGPHGQRGKFIIQGDERERRTPLICANLPCFVECLGGEYFFMPGLEALKVIAGARQAQAGAA
jgi:Dyp-type peroxidase family